MSKIMSKDKPKKLKPLSANDLAREKLGINTFFEDKKVYGPSVLESMYTLLEKINKLEEDNEYLESQIAYWKKRYENKIFAND